MLIVLLAVVATACGSGSATGSSTTSIARSTTTVTAPATTTTTTLATPTSADELERPTDHLAGFRFTSSALDEGDDGWVAVGVFVAPDAVVCTVGNPAWMSPELGTVTAIGEAAWWDDDLGVPEAELRARDFFTDTLRDCPGSAGFWDLPLMSDGVFGFGDQAPGEPIEGLSTTRITLVSRESDVVVDEAYLWITDEGWPIKLEINGAAPGGAFGVQGIEGSSDSEGNQSGGTTAFTLGFELTEIDAGSLMVRAPDGSAVVGPIGPIEPSIPGFPAVSPELDQAVDQARDDMCMRSNPVLDILEPLGTDAGLGHFSVASENPEFGGATFNVTGTFVVDNFDDRVITTVEPDVADDHAMLFFTHMAPLVGFVWWTGYGPSNLPTDEEGYMDWAVWDSNPIRGEAERVATWDGAFVRFADGSERDLGVRTLMSPPFELRTLDEATVGEGWRIIDEWAPTVVEVADLVSTGDAQAITDLQAVSGQIDDARALACVLLADAFTRAEDAQAMDSDAFQDAPELVVAEERAQSLLLFINYLEVMVVYMERPDIDWLMAEGAILFNGVFPDDTAGEHLQVLGHAAEDAWWMTSFFFAP